MSELLVVLNSAFDPVFTKAVERARAAVLSREVEVAVIRSEMPVPVLDLLDIYRTRRAIPQLPPERAEEIDNLLRALERSAGEHWNIYAIENGRLTFAVFATDAGLGRACLSF